MKIHLVKNYIDGEWVDSQSTRQSGVHNPVTGGVIAQVPMSTIIEVNNAVASAKSAFEEWRETAMTLKQL